MKHCRRIIDMPNISVRADLQQPGRSRALAQSLGLAELIGTSALQLAYKLDVLTLYDANNDPHGAGLCVDFCAGSSAHRLKFGGGRQQALARAVGMRANITPRIIDVTAGLGRDAFVLASLGAQVLLIERNPILHALLQDALARALANPAINPIAARIELINADSKLWLPTLKLGAADVIYMDPMYPERDQSALVKKAMRSIRLLVGADDDSQELLQIAMSTQAARVVVKRPKSAPALLGASAANIASKNTRYDIYPQQKIQNFEGVL